MPVPSIPTIPTLGYRKGGVTVSAAVPAGPPAMVGTPGTAVYSDASVVDPTTLTPDTGTGYAIGDVILCFTACWGKTSLCATPAGWTSLCDTTGTSAFHIALFGKVAASTTETAPSVVWSTLTTGVAGWPSGAQCAAFSGLNTTSIATIVDVTGATGNSGTSATLCNGGNQFTPLINNDLIIKMGIHGNATADTWGASGYTNVSGGVGAGASLKTTSGVDMAAQWAYKVKTVAALEAVANFVISGNVTTVTSMGVMVALKAA